MTETVSYTALRDLIDWYSKDGTKKGEVTLDALLELKHLRGILPDGPIVAWMDDRGGVITSAMKSQIEPAGSMPSVWSIPLSPTLRQSDTRIEGGGEPVEWQIEALAFDWEYTDPKTGRWSYARTPERAERLQAQGVKLTPVYTMDAVRKEQARAAVKSPTPEHVEGDVLSVGEMPEDCVEKAARAIAFDEWAFATDAERTAWSDKHWPRYVSAARSALSSAQSSIQRAERERDEAIDRAKVWEHYWQQEVKVKGEVISWCKDYQTRIAALEAQLADAVKVLEAVGHIGVDFGYGPYVLEEKHIEAARAFLSTIGEKPDAE